jgi:hypothetical protein
MKGHIEIGIAKNVGQGARKLRAVSSFFRKHASEMQNRFVGADNTGSVVATNYQATPAA